MSRPGVRVPFPAPGGSAVRAASACTRPRCRRVCSWEQATAADDARPEQPDRAGRLRRSRRGRRGRRCGCGCRCGARAGTAAGAEAAADAGAGAEAVDADDADEPLFPPPLLPTGAGEGSIPPAGAAAGVAAGSSGRVGHRCDGYRVHYRFLRRAARLIPRVRAVSGASLSFAPATATGVARDEPVNEHDQQRQRRERAQRSERPPVGLPETSRPSAHGRPELRFRDTGSQELPVAPEVRSPIPERVHHPNLP